MPVCVLRGSPVCPPPRWWVLCGVLPSVWVPCGWGPPLSCSRFPWHLFLSCLSLVLTLSQSIKPQTTVFCNTSPGSSFFRSRPCLAGRHRCPHTGIRKRENRIQYTICILIQPPTRAFSNALPGSSFFRSRPCLAGRHR